MPAEAVPARVTVSPGVVAGIDFLRGIFAILVVVSHAVYFPIGNKTVTAAYSPLLAATLASGAFSVRGFFVLSGFCINLSVINAFAARSYTAGGYALARFSRIYPMYLVGLAAAVAAWWVSRVLTPSAVPLTAWFDWPAFLGQLVMTQGFTHSLLFYGISWTLTSEVAYYAVWPVAVRVSGSPGARTAVGATLATLGVVLSIVAVWKVCAHGSTTSWMIPFWTVPAGAPMWLAGAWLAARWNQLSALPALPRWRHWVWLLIPAAYALQSYVGYTNPKAWINWLHQYACIPAYLLLILWLQGLPAPSESVRRICRYLGELSYPLYLLHSPVIGLTGAIMGYFKLHFGTWTMVAIAVTVSLLAGGLPGVALEAAIMRWRKGLLRAHDMKNPLDPLLKPV